MILFSEPLPNFMETVTGNCPKTGKVWLDGKFGFLDNISILSSRS